MSTADDRDRIRIGDAERDAADKALREHLAAGRLTMDEYSERVAQVYSARTRGEIDALFSDLPSGPFGSPPRRAQVQPAYAGLPEERTGGSPAVPDNTRRVLIALMGAAPIIALVLFLGFRVWWIWLLIPLAGALLAPYLKGDDGKDDRSGT